MDNDDLANRHRRRRRSSGSGSSAAGRTGTLWLVDQLELEGGDDDDGGHAGFHVAKLDKGKGRAKTDEQGQGDGRGDLGNRAYGQYDEADGDVGVIGRQGDTDWNQALQEEQTGDTNAEGHGGSETRFPPQVADDDEREAKRIADHLAQWSRAEAQRRKNARKTQVLVLPPAPSPTVLARRSSSLLRAGSQRISRGARAGVSAAEPASQDDAGLIRRDSKRAQRKQSALLRDEADDETYAIRLHDIPESVPRSTTADDGVESASPLTTPTLAQGSSNPFASRPGSTVRSDSYDRQSSRHNSRFTEDLPPSSSSAASTPAASSMVSNPFEDAIEMRNNVGAGVVGSSDDRSSLLSQDTVVGVGKHGNEGTGVRDSAEYEAGMYIGHVEYGPTSPMRSGARALARAYPLDEQDGDDDDDDDDDEQDDAHDKGRIGWLDFLLCDCFRTRDGNEDDDTQAGRTNPNE